MREASYEDSAPTSAARRLRPFTASSVGRNSDGIPRRTTREARWTRTRTALAAALAARAATAVAVSAAAAAEPLKSAGRRFVVRTGAIRRPARRLLEQRQVFREAGGTRRQQHRVEHLVHRRHALERERRTQLD